MNRNSDDEGIYGPESGRRRKERNPKTSRRDPGKADGAPSRDSEDGSPAARAAADDFTVESVEIAGMLAEQAVHLFHSTRTGPGFMGESAVEVRFHDRSTLASFRRTGSARFVRSASAWRLVRRWAETDGDGGLDEEMCRVVAKYLNMDFAGRLRASVVTWVFGERPSGG